MHVLGSEGPPVPGKARQLGADCASVCAAQATATVAASSKRPIGPVRDLARDLARSLTLQPRSPSSFL